MGDARTQLHESMLRLAADAFAPAGVEQVGAGEWIVRRPDSGMYWARVIARDSFLIVVGDVETCVFQGYVGAEDAVAWVAKAQIGYLQSKAVRGMGQPMRIDDLDAALADLEELADSLGEAKAAEVRDLLEDGDIESARYEIAYGVEDGAELAERFGRVPDPAIYYAQAACRRIVEHRQEEGYLLQEARACGDFALWWKKGRCGYTVNIDEAHVFTQDEAARFQGPAYADRLDIPWPVGTIRRLASRTVSAELLASRRREASAQERKEDNHG